MKQAESTLELLSKKAQLLARNKVSKGGETPSQRSRQVYFMCEPVYVDTRIKNNAWMKNEKPIDKEKFHSQWGEFFNRLASNSIIYLITPAKGLQDQTYVNCAMYLPHIKHNDVILLSNFTAEGREGEEVVAGSFFHDHGYQIIKSPYKFEGEPDLKYIRDNIYLGGYGIRTNIKTLKWIRDNFDARVIPLRESDPKLYHLDCSVMPCGRENVIMCTDLFSKEEIKRVESVANIIPVSKNGAYMGICNSVKLDDIIFNSSNLQFMSKHDEDYEKERKKCVEFEKITDKYGYEPRYVDLSECEKSGAYLSCFVMHGNWRD